MHLFNGEVEMKKAAFILSLSVSLMVFTPMARADLISFMNDVNKQALSDINNFNKQLSKQFGIPVPDVEAIVNSLPNPADAFMIFQLGQMAHVQPEIVLRKYRHSGKKGWGSMAHELGIKPGSAEFHALKRGDLYFAGMGGGVDMEQGGRGNGHGHGHGHGNGRGKNKDRD